MILDTNALSALLASDPSLLSVLGSSDLYLPVIVIGEYRYGMAGSASRSIIEKAFDEFEKTVNVLDVDRRTALLYGEIRHRLKKQGSPIPENDIWIAALARQHRLPLVTRDEHFGLVDGIKRIHW